MTQQDIDDALSTIPRILEENGLRGAYTVTGNRVRIIVGTDGEPGFSVTTFDAVKMVRAAVLATVPLVLVKEADIIATPLPEPAAEPEAPKPKSRFGRGRASE